MRIVLLLVDRVDHPADRAALHRARPRDLRPRPHPPRRRPVPAGQGDARDSRRPGRREGHRTAEVAPRFGAVIGQIMLLDIVFSLDSVITAVGMAEDLSIMVPAVVLAVVVMMFSAGPISAFVNRHPTVKILALSFLLLIGISLIGDGLDMHIPKGYIYFAMGFSVFVEMINMRIRAPRPSRCTCTSPTPAAIDDPAADPGTVGRDGAEGRRRRPRRRQPDDPRGRAHRDCGSERRRQVDARQPADPRGAAAGGGDAPPPIRVSARIAGTSSISAPASASSAPISISGS